MKKFLLFCLLAFGGYKGWRSYQNGLAMPTSPQADPSTTAVATPAPTPRGPVPSVDLIGSAWKEHEVGDWQGTWTRRGFSNIFDAKIRGGNGTMTKTFVAVVTRDGNSIHVDSYHASDGRNCTYDGTLSPDGSKITGAYTWSTNRDSFGVEIIPVVRTAFSFAPDGTFFLLDYKSVTSSKGVTGFPPGTQVTRISANGDTLLVRSEGQEFQVQKNEVTNDLDLASDIAMEDSSEQTAAYAKGTADASAYSQARAKELQREAADLNRRLASSNAQQGITGRSSNPLDRGAYGQTSIPTGRLRRSTSEGEYTQSSNAASYDEETRKLQAQIAQANQSLSAYKSARQAALLDQMNALTRDNSLHGRDFLSAYRPLRDEYGRLQQMQ